MNKRVLSWPVGRCVGLDVRLDFIEIAICEEGKVFSAGRVPSTPEGIGTLAESLLATDRVALEVTGSSWEIVRLLEPHVSKVIVVSPGDTGISQARAKTDRLDARTLARLLWTGELEAVWVPPEWISRMRRRLSRRGQLVRARSRAKNEIHAVLMRRLKGRPPVSDLFGVKGRDWLRGLQLPLEEAETVKAGLRHIEFLDSEIEQVERLICQEALGSRQVRRLMTVPGVNVICAAVFLAAVGDIKRFNGSHQVVAYLGLDPRVYQSGSGPARGGRISKQGSPQARWALVEAARSVAQQPGPLHAFPERIRAAKATTPRSSRSRANSPCCSGACSPARRTTPTSSPHSPPRSSGDWKSAPAPPPWRASPPACGPPASGCATPRSSSPRRPRPPTNARSPTGKPHPPRTPTRARA